MTFSNLYDHKCLVRRLFQLALLIGLMRITGGAAYVAVVPLLLFGLIQRRTEMLFFWLLVSICLVIGNVNIVYKNFVFALAQRSAMMVVGGCMAIQVFGGNKHKVLKPFLFMLVYAFFMCLSSAQGWCPAISFMKLTMFTFIYFAYFGVANKACTDCRVPTVRLRSIMLTAAIFFVFGSMALLPFPGLSQMKASQILEMGGSVEDLKNMKSLFVGMTTHSQCLGPVISVIAVVLLGDLLFSIKKFDWLYVSLLGCCPILVYKTSSRTGMGALLLGLSFVIFLFLRSRGITKRWRRRVVSCVMTIAILSFGMIVAIPHVQDNVREFVLKFNTKDKDVSVSNVLMTRQGKIDIALENFKKSPMMGNGFQVSESMKGMKVNGLVLSAPIEKGVWITAVLEEGGVIGFLIFSAYLLICIVTCIRCKSYIGASSLFVLTLTNLGEFTFFSMSYAGGFSWAMVFIGLAFDIRRANDERQARMHSALRVNYSLMSMQSR